MNHLTPEQKQANETRRQQKIARRRQERIAQNQARAEKRAAFYAALEAGLITFKVRNTGRDGKVYVSHLPVPYVREALGQPGKEGCGLCRGLGRNAANRPCKCIRRPAAWWWARWRRPPAATRACPGSAAATPRPPTTPRPPPTPPSRPRSPPPRRPRREPRAADPPAAPTAANDAPPALPLRALLAQLALVLTPDLGPGPVANEDPAEVA
jgi:hypothetical protein